ncbi:MAG: TIGR00300 family protein [Acidobacteria bacterium]|nr:MAG: TIGR00300 family protein [Acidobacteriota bacterium]
MSKFQEPVEIEGHLIDSGILKYAFDKIVEHEGQFEVLDFRIGKNNQETSKVRMLVKAHSQEQLEEILAALEDFGAVVDWEDCNFVETQRDGLLPDDFYSTTNFDTFVKVKGEWFPVTNQKMDSVIVWEDGYATTKKISEVKKGDWIATGRKGIRVRPQERSREYSVFDFMSNDLTAEVNKSLLIAEIAKEIVHVKESGKKVALVPGPAIIHSGADQYLKEIIQMGFIDVVLTGNAFAVHDIEKALLNTSLGVNQSTGKAVEGGHRNHLWAINEINKTGGIERACESGLLKSGLMYECIRLGIHTVLAGSIRDDGPLVDVITDCVQAQKKYIEALEDVAVVLMLASTLHSIAVGNLLKGSVKTVCVDINESTPLKLSNRGSKQAIGIVTDVSFFLSILASELKKQQQECVESAKHKTIQKT